MILLKKNSIRGSITFATLLCPLLLFTSCNPAIHSFTAEPLTVTSRDSVKVAWEVNGKPTLFYHENIVMGDAGSRGADGIIAKYLEFTLAVAKGGKEVRRKIQVILLPDTSSTEIIFPTILHGDTLIATGIKNPTRWGTDFQIMMVSSDALRKVFVSHGGKTVELNADGSQSNALASTFLEGPWEIRSLLTNKENENRSLAPESLQINAIIQYKKR